MTPPLPFGCIVTDSVVTVRARLEKIDGEHLENE
jgi:hypothetical protein